MRASSIFAIALLKALRDRLRHKAGVSKRIQLANVVRILDHRRYRIGVQQNQVLNQEFNIADAAAALLEIELSIRAAIKLITHLATHVEDLIAQGLTTHTGG